ncbi:MAG: hypothetical protein K1X81_06530 [Bacteroidia bacterium]|nr:hypothetical protein [Bacteroidia bacterium]
MKIYSCKKSILVCFFVMYVLDGFTQKKVYSSFSYAPLISFLTPYKVTSGFDRYRNDLYDYETLARGFKIGYTASVDLSKRLKLKFSLDLQEEQYILTQRMQDSTGTTAKFINTNRFTLLHPSIGISYVLPQLDSIRFFVGIGYKHFFFVGGGTSQYEDVRGNFSGLISTQASTEPLKGYAGLIFGLSKFTKSKRFEYGVYYQVAKGSYPRTNYRNQLGSLISEGWSAPRVNCLLFQLNYNLGKRF